MTISVKPEVALSSKKILKKKRKMNPRHYFKGESASSSRSYGQGPPSHPRVGDKPSQSINKRLKRKPKQNMESNLVSDQ
jgi:hypothetical protein